MKKKIISFALTLTLLFTFSFSALAANGDGTLTAKIDEIVTGYFLITVKYESGNNSIKAGIFEVLTPDGKTALLTSPKVSFANKTGAYSFFIEENIPANALLRMTEDKANKPVVIVGKFNEVFTLPEVPAVACEHNWVAGEVVAPTCTEDGYTVYKCTVCGDIENRDDVDATGHNESDFINSAPTCTEAGSTITKCTVCEYEMSVVIYDPIGHDYATVTTEPNCEEIGFDTHTCSVCGDVNINNEVPALGHTPAEEGVMNPLPTCTKPGILTYYCIVCSGVVSTEIIDELGHTTVKIENGNVSYSAPTYTGSGNEGRKGSTNVSIKFTLSDGNTVTEVVEFKDVNVNNKDVKTNTEKTVVLPLGCYDVSVNVVLITAGNGNGFTITGASAAITNSVIDCEEEDEDEGKNADGENHEEDPSDDSGDTPVL